MEVLRSLAALAPLRDRVEALVLASRAPSLFGSPGWLERRVAQEELPAPGAEPRLLVALDGDAPVGFLPLRRVPGKVPGIGADRIEFLTPHDVERPGMACRPEDEERCARAFLGHLAARERGVGLVELVQQEDRSPLALAAAELPGWRLRRWPNPATALLGLEWPTSAAWFRSLSRRFRRSVRLGLNRLLAAGRAELVSSWDPAATARLFDLHLGVEARSWKAGTGTGLARSPVRVAFFRSLLAGAGPFRANVRLLLLDGVPVASELNGEFAGSWYGFETTHDEAYRDVSPGHVLFVASVVDAYARGLREMNCLNGHSEIKRRYGAAIIDTAAVQLFRRGSALDLKARAGEALRGLGPVRRASQGTVDLHRDAPDPAAGAERPDRSAVARESAELLRACGAALERRPLEDLRAIVLAPEADG
ncbi:MAG: GNAT family N-acetyltransferase [Anaeromyxobacter sp.]